MEREREAEVSKQTSTASNHARYLSITCDAGSRSITFAHITGGGGREYARGIDSRTGRRFIHFLIVAATIGVRYSVETVLLMPQHRHILPSTNT